MVKNKRNNLIIILVVAAVLIVGYIALSGDDEGTVGIETFGLEEVIFTGEEQIDTVDRPGEKIYLIIEGSFNRITVTKGTDLEILEIRGSNNRVNVCDDVIGLKINQQGGDNSIFYSTC